MNSLERVGTILQHKEADRVPVYPILSGVTRKLTGVSYKEWATKADCTAEAMIKATEEFGLDVICTLTDLSVEAADFGQKIIYPENEAAHPDFYDYLIKDIEEYKKVQKINPRETPRMSEHIKLCDMLVKAKGKDTPIVAFIFGPLGITSMLRGQQDMYMDLYDDPDAVKDCVEVVTEVLIEYCDALIETGVHAIMIDTLFASKSIMSKEMWMEFEGGYVKRLAKHIHDRGCMVMIHNCGVGIYFDVQIETMKPEAISFLHVPDDCKSFAEAKEKYGHITTLIGHIPPPWIISATKEEVEEECKKEIEELKKDGGFILATGCEYPANSSLENARVMVEVAKKYGMY
jgi:uroporphyrinogen decarboxylase